MKKFIPHHFPHIRFRRIFAIFSALLMLFSPCTPAYALPTNDKLLFFELNNIYYYDPTGAACSSQNSAAGGVSILAGNDQAERIWNFFAKAGIAGVSDSAAVIAGIMGNLYQESTFNPFAVTGSVYGIFQAKKEYFPEIVSAIDEAGYASYWGKKINEVPEDIVIKATEIELNLLVNDYSRWAKTDYAFTKHLSDVSTITPEAYSDLFLVAIEGAVTDTVSASTYIEDAGARKLGVRFFSSSKGGGQYYQDAASRRNFAREFYDKYATKIGNSSTTSSSSQKELAENYKDFVNFHYQLAQSLSVEYGIPWEAVMAQAILESSYEDENGVNIPGTSPIAIDKNNFFGIGAYDSCPYECAVSYASEEEGWRGYYENIRKTSTYRNHGVFQGNTITDPLAYLTAITLAGYAGAEYYDSVAPLAESIQNYASSQGWDSSAQLASKFPVMLDNAAKNAAGASGAVAVNISSSASACIGSGTMSPYTSSEFPHYKQNESPWGSLPYGSCGTIGDSGCGPTSFAMMATVLLGVVITPDMTAKVAGDAGMHICGEGSDWGITKVLADYYGLQYKTISGSGTTEEVIARINEALLDGWMIHTSGAGTNPFTSGGHYIGIRGLTEDGKWLIADSNGNKGKTNTYTPFEPSDIINAGMRLANIKAIKR